VDFEALIVCTPYCPEGSYDFNVISVPRGENSFLLRRSGRNCWIVLHKIEVTNIPIDMS
jgi:hypothetical protein